MFLLCDTVTNAECFLSKRVATDVDTVLKVMLVSVRASEEPGGKM